MREEAAWRVSRAVPDPAHIPVSLLFSLQLKSEVYLANTRSRHGPLSGCGALPSAGGD